MRRAIVRRVGRTSLGADVSDIPECPHSHKPEEERGDRVYAQESTPPQYGQQNPGCQRAHHIAYPPADTMVSQGHASPFRKVMRKRGGGRQVPDGMGDRHHANADQEQPVDGRHTH